MTETVAALIFTASLPVTAIGIGAGINYGKQSTNTNALLTVICAALGLLMSFVAGVMLP